MTIEEYLENLVQIQSNIPKKYLQRINDLKDKIRDIILNLDKISQKPIPYDAGSKKKHTMIKEAFDLDLLFYYPSKTTESIKDIYNYIYKAMELNFEHVSMKNVSIRLDFPYEEDLEKHHFHVDVVPAKRKSGSEDEAWLFPSKSPETERLKTSLEKHIKAVQEFKNYGVLKLLKLWKSRKSINCPSIVLEQIANEATKNVENENLQRKELLKIIFDYICNKLPKRTHIEDPANPSHNLLDEEILEEPEKNKLVNFACSALKEDLDTIQGWKNIFKLQSSDSFYASGGVRQRDGKIHPNAPNTRRFG